MSKQSTTFDDVVAVGTSNARAAIDHLGDPFYADPVASYRQNVIDTIEELDATHYLAFALAAYDGKIIEARVGKAGARKSAKVLNQKLQLICPLITLVNEVDSLAAILKVIRAHYVSAMNDVDASRGSIRKVAEVRAEFFSNVLDITCGADSPLEVRRRLALLHVRLIEGLMGQS